MLWVVLFFIAYEGAEGNGVVKSAMETGNTWPKEGVKKYTHYLGCDYRHNFPSDPDWTYTYDISCIKNVGESHYTLSVNYDNNVFDNFVVESCKLEDIINSVFPPKQKSEYLPDERDSEGMPVISYLKYKTEDGKCYSRKYQYVNRKATAATRYAPEEIDCPGKPGWLKYGEVARFTNCRVPTLPLRHTVKGWSPRQPILKPIRKHKKLLECTFDQFSQLFNLTCVVDNKANEYFSFVSYQNYALDKFTVTSCKEEDIVNGIFPEKDTTANPKRYSRLLRKNSETKKGSGKEYDFDSWLQNIWFSNENGDCFKREYNSYGPRGNVTIVDCPKYPDEWTNPSWGFAGQWRECGGPMSLNERAKKRSETS